MVALFAGASWWAMKESLYRSTDTDLNYRMRAVVPFYSEPFAQHWRAIQEGVYNLLRFLGGRRVRPGHRWSEEYSVRIRHTSVASRTGSASGATDGSTSVTTVPVTTPQNDSWPVRVVTRRLTVAGADLDIHVVEPLRDIMEV